jgi:hypothetical protein
MALVMSEAALAPFRSWPDRAELDGIDEDDAGELALSFELAEAQARDELIATPEVFADWLAAACTGARSPVNFSEIPRSGDMICMDVHLVAALFFAGTEAQSRHARYELRERFLAENKDAIAARVADLMKEPA